VHDLVYRQGRFLYRLAPGSHSTPKRLVEVGADEVWGLAITSDRIFWVATTGTAKSGGPQESIMEASMRDLRPRTLVPRVGATTALVASGTHLFWLGQHSIGRLRLDGSMLNRRFIELPQEKGGSIADGLATDGQYLYFSRCFDDGIGRVPLATSATYKHFPLLLPTTCPGDLAIAAGYVYWTAGGAVDPGAVGRASLAGGAPEATWAPIQSSQGPLGLATDGRFVYWSWGGEAGSPTFVGRITVDGKGIQRRFLEADQPLGVVPCPCGSS
jgi:hypothetical protein